MSVTITITGDFAGEVLDELKGLTKGLLGNTSEPEEGWVPATAEEVQFNVKTDETAQAEPETHAEKAASEIGDCFDDADEPELDSAGVPFDPEIHTGTKLKDGTWRAKKGKKEEAEALAEEVSTSTENTGETESTESGGASEPTAEDEDDDEFAAFTKAAAEVEETEEAEVEVPARKWTDADLSQLCNNAAVKLGDPSPVKALIAKYVPEGEVPHSRNIPTDEREAFAQEVEKAAGIEYAG